MFIFFVSVQSVPYLCLFLKGKIIMGKIIKKINNYFVRESFCHFLVPLGYEDYFDLQDLNSYLYPVHLVHPVQEFRAS